MTKDEIVKSLRACGRNCCDDCVCFKEKMLCKVKNLEAADLIEQQAARIAELEAKVPRWIPVTEKIPPDQEEVLVLARSKKRRAECGQGLLGNRPLYPSGTCGGHALDAAAGSAEGGLTMDDLKKGDIVMNIFAGRRNPTRFLLYIGKGACRQGRYSQKVYNCIGESCARIISTRSAWFMAMSSRPKNQLSFTLRRMGRRGADNGNKTDM